MRGPGSTRSTLSTCAQCAAYNRSTWGTHPYRGMPGVLVCGVPFGLIKKENIPVEGGDCAPVSPLGGEAHWRVFPINWLKITRRDRSACVLGSVGSLRPIDCGKSR